MSIDEIPGFSEIVELSPETESTLFEKAERSKALINGIALNVLDRMPKQGDDCSRAVKFLHHVIYLDSKYHDKFQTNPFQPIIAKLQAALAHLKPAAEKFRIEVLAKLKALDLDSPKFKAQIVELTALFDRLERANGITAMQKLQLLGALKAIQPGYFKQSVFECRAWQFISERCPAFKTALESADTFFKSVELDGQRGMLKHLKQSCTLVEIADSCTRVKIALKKQLVINRVDHITARIQENNHFSNPNFIQNFIYLLQTIKKFALKSAHPIFLERWQALLKVIDPEENGQFVKLLKNYPDLCPDSFIPKLITKAEAFFLRPLDVRLLCEQDHVLFKEKIAEINRSAPAKLLGFFTKNYNQYLLLQHCWIACNMSAIVKPYDQSADIHRNQASGTCFQNSLDRHEVLLLDPHEDATAICMGSSASGRARQAGLAYAFVGVKKGVISLKEAADRQMDSSKRVGLVRSSDQALSADTPEQLVRLIDVSHENQADRLWILVLTCPNGGHAINIQITHNLGIFRFIDDNLGICQWIEYKQFHTQFLAYLMAFYPEYTNFSLETYRKV